jgi:thiamine pyrophosphate-dependent acetolactate synthase large subunit-like protein
LNAPIVHALRGKEFIEYDNPYDVGMTACSGSPPDTRRSRACARLMLGTDFPYQQFYPDNAKVIQVDIRGRNLGWRLRSTAVPSGRNTLRDWRINSPPTTRCSPATSAHRWCGRRDT